MKIKVNDNEYNVEIENERIVVNNNKMDLKIERDKINLDDNIFYLDFLDEGEPSLMIINGSTYVISKKSSIQELNNEIRSPINGKVTDLLVHVDESVKKDQTILVIEAMKMENQIKSHMDGVIKKISVVKNQLVKKGDVIITFQENLSHP